MKKAVILLGLGLLVCAWFVVGCMGGKSGGEVYTNSADNSAVSMTLNGFMKSLTSGNNVSVEKFFSPLYATATQSAEIIAQLKVWDFGSDITNFNDNSSYTFQILDGGIIYQSQALAEVTAVYNPRAGVTFVLNFKLQKTDNEWYITDIRFDSTASQKLAIYKEALPVGRVAQSYGYNFKAVGGTATYSWISDSPLPSGLTLSIGGNLSGTPTLFGVATFTIRVTDKNLEAATEPYSLQILPAYLTAAVTPASGAVNVATTTTGISVIFNRPIASATFNSSNVIVWSAVSGVIPGVYLVDPTGMTGQFSFLTPLAEGTTYYAKISSGVLALDGGMLAQDMIWRFSTVVFVDTIPPDVVAVFPLDGSANVPVNTQVSLTFSEPIQQSSVISNFSLVDAALVQVAGNFTFNANDTQATFTPSVALSYIASYSSRIANVADVAGNLMTAQKTYSFSTGIQPDTTPPMVLSVTTPYGATNVATNTTISMTFNELINTTTLTNANITLTANSLDIPGNIGFGGASATIATFTPTSALPYSASCALTISAGVADITGNPLPAPYIATFSTRAAPSIMLVSPSDGTTGVMVSPSIFFDFSDPIDTIIPKSGWITLMQVGSGTIPGTCFNTFVSPSLVNFVPSVQLDYSATYMVTVSTSVCDIYGNHLPKIATWTFTTQPPPTPMTASAAYVDSTTIAVNFPFAVGPNYIATANYILENQTVRKSDGFTLTTPYSPSTAAISGANGVILTFASFPSNSTTLRLKVKNVIDTTGNYIVATNPIRLTNIVNLYNYYSWASLGTFTGTKISIKVPYEAFGLLLTCSDRVYSFPTTETTGGGNLSISTATTNIWFNNLSSYDSTYEVIDSILTTNPTSGDELWCLFNTATQSYIATQTTPATASSIKSNFAGMKRTGSLFQNIQNSSWLGNVQLITDWTVNGAYTPDGGYTNLTTYLDGPPIVASFGTGLTTVALESVTDGPEEKIRVMNTNGNILALYTNSAGANLAYDSLVPVIPGKTQLTYADYSGAITLTTPSKFGMYWLKVLDPSDTDLDSEFLITAPDDNKVFRFSPAKSTQVPWLIDDASDKWGALNKPFSTNLYLRSSATGPIGDYSFWILVADQEGIQIFRRD